MELKVENLEKVVAELKAKMKGVGDDIENNIGKGAEKGLSRVQR